MGIGVYQARELIRSLGGEIRVTSSVGVGTTVAITLPLAQPTSDRQVSELRCERRNPCGIPENRFA
jgi:signal transduction histidine kinase